MRNILIYLFYIFLFREPPPTGTYAEFLRDTFSVFTTGLDRELYCQEQNLTVCYLLPNLVSLLAKLNLIALK